MQAGGFGFSKERTPTALLYSWQKKGRRFDVNQAAPLEERKVRGPGTKNFKYVGKVHILTSQGSDATKRISFLR